ncbi:MAG: hypothetical protein HN712_17010 [Gemmatimonadetes bacterium]|jgi:hypothetical protein|nr:hypothetical protein [Gemmatimonadota bacterium]MBT6144496.1 hypothetical protein [Gemmatimonadota bacterium]MBT7862018.1 hypothetical protein [Gemmatimonadota bacterium]
MVNESWRARRLDAHGLAAPVEAEADYVELFRRLQPVAPGANSYPGSPPRLEYRVGGPDGDDTRLADELRATHKLIKGRYFGGRVSYVWVEDLALYRSACQRPMNTINDRHAAVLRAFEVSGPLSPRQLREQTGMAYRPLMAAVNRLEEAFLVCEDQTDDAWDRPLHLFEREWPQAYAAKQDRLEAREEVLRRWAAVNVWVSVEGAAATTGWPKRELAKLLGNLCEEGRLRPVDAVQADMGAQYLVEPQCLAGPDGEEIPPVPRAVRVLHRDDPFVRPLLPMLKARYEKREVLKYLLIDDDVSGAVCGHWRISPHDVEDILVDDEETARDRREDVLTVVTASYPPPERQILHYNGEPI